MTQNNNSKFSIRSRLLSLFSKRKHSLGESVAELIKEHDLDENINNEEKEILNNLADFGHIKVYEIMVPRTDIIAVSHKATYNEVKNCFIEKGYTRLPIYKNNLDEVIGFVHLKDFFCIKSNTENFDITSIMREVLYVPRSMRLVVLLDKVKQTNTHIAVVLDEYGGTDGIITVEDIVEEIIGDIPDEHNNDTDIELIELDKDTYNIEGRTEIEEVEEKLNISLSDEEGEYETFGGFILSYLGKIPQAGEVFEHPSGIIIEVTEANNRCVKNTKVIVKK